MISTDTKVVYNTLHIDLSKSYMSNLHVHVFMIIRNFKSIKAVHRQSDIT